MKQEKYIDFKHLGNYWIVERKEKQMYSQEGQVWYKRTQITPRWDAVPIYLYATAKCTLGHINWDTGTAPKPEGDTIKNAVVSFPSRQTLWTLTHNARLRKNATNGQQHRQSGTIIYSGEGARGQLDQLFTHRHAARIQRGWVHPKPKPSMAQEWNKKAFWRKLSDRVQQHSGCAQQEIISQESKEQQVSQRSLPVEWWMLCQAMLSLLSHCMPVLYPHQREA